MKRKGRQELLGKAEAGGTTEREHDQGMSDGTEGLLQRQMNWRKS